MTINAEKTPPQIEHLFVRGLRFEGELQYWVKASGNIKAAFRGIRDPKAGRDGGRAWCSAVAGGILGVLPVRERATIHQGWKLTDAETIEKTIHQRGLAMVQLKDRYSTWWALVTGVEQDQARQTVTGLLLLDVTQGLPWGVGYNARVRSAHESMAGPLKWSGIDGGCMPVHVVLWIELDGS